MGTDAQQIYTPFVYIDIHPGKPLDGIYVKSGAPWAQLCKAGPYLRAWLDGTDFILDQDNRYQAGIIFYQ